MISGSPLPPEPASFLGKASENLADAQVALDAGRNNACANRSYYAAFQAAVAARWVENIRPRAGGEGPLSHRMVQAEFAGRLIYRRKLYPPGLQSVLLELMRLRLIADYHAESVNPHLARRALAKSEQLVGHVQARLVRE
jgi:uncharacterized protein (UPF0332 family)